LHEWGLLLEDGDQLVPTRAAILSPFLAYAALTVIHPRSKSTSSQGRARSSDRLRPVLSAVMIMRRSGSLPCVSKRLSSAALRNRTRPLSSRAKRIFSLGSRRPQWYHCVLNRTFERLERHAGKLARIVLRGLSGSNLVRLPGG
jgi:hypothetical protein